MNTATNQASTYIVVLAPPNMTANLPKEKMMSPPVVSLSEPKLETIMVSPSPPPPPTVSLTATYMPIVKQVGSDVLTSIKHDVFHGHNLVCNKFKDHYNNNNNSNSIQANHNILKKGNDKQEDNANDITTAVQTLPGLLEFEFNCKEVFHKTSTGTGNLLILFYAFCLVA